MERDNFSFNEIIKFAKLCAAKMANVRYCELLNIFNIITHFLLFSLGLIFCSAQQYGRYFDAFSKEENLTPGKYPWFVLFKIFLLFFKYLFPFRYIEYAGFKQHGRQLCPASCVEMVFFFSRGSNKDVIEKLTCQQGSFYHGSNYRNIIMSQKPKEEEVCFFVYCFF